MQLPNRQLVTIWQIPVALLLFLAGTIALSELPYADQAERTPSLLEAAYYTMGLFLGGENPIGWPSDGPGWAVALARLAYFGCPLVLAWAVLEGVLKFTRRFARTFLASPERQIDAMEGHVVLGGLGKLGNMVVEMLVAGGVKVVVVENNTENQYLKDMERLKVPVFVGDMTVPDNLERAGIRRARKMIAICGDDIANLDACHIARRLNKDLTACCQVTDVQLKKLVEEAAEMEIESFNSYDIAAKNLVRAEIVGTVGSEAAPLFILAGIGRFGRMMAENLIETYGDRELKILIVDRRGDHIGRVLRGTSPRGEEFFDEADIYQADITDPYVWRDIRDANEVNRGTVVLCTDNDINNINTALMIEDQIGREILVVSRMFRDVSFMEGREDRFKVAVLSRLVRQGILDAIGETVSA